MDYFNDDISKRLSDSIIYKSLKRKCEIFGDVVASQVLSVVHNVAGYACDRSKLIIKYMNEFTLHDDVHLFRLLKITEKLIPESTLEKLSAAELQVLLVSIFLHDIGMAPSEIEVRCWLKQWETDTPSQEELEEYNNFEQYRNAQIYLIEEINKLNFAEAYEKAHLIEQRIVTDYIRITHSQRAREIISNEWDGKLKFQDTDLTNEIAQICFSHTENALDLLNMESSYLCGESVYICFPFIGALLRLADILDFDGKRTPNVLFSHLVVKNPISIKEWNKHRSIDALTISNDKIIYSAKCSHPAIEATIRKFCDYIDDELKNCTLVLSQIYDDIRAEELDFYRIKLPAQVDRSKIGAKKEIITGKPIYTYRETQFNLNKNQIIDLLMGTKLYGNKDVALRELIQNSIDACLVRKALSESWGDKYEPKIEVELKTIKGEDYLIVNDNGIGMNQYIIDNYYSKIGSSYYKSQDFYKLKSDSKLDYNPISRFGIGILSCFMVSDNMEVNTRRVSGQYEFDESINISIEGYDSLFYVKRGKRKEPGTESILHLRKENPWSSLSREAFISSVKRTVPNPPFEIKVKTDKESITYDKEYFLLIEPETLKNYTWQDSDDNIKEIKIDLTDESIGIKGKVIVAILESSDTPKEKIEILSKTIEIDDESYELNLVINLDTNEIDKKATSINVDDEGGIRSSDSYTTLAKSNAFISINGIEYANKIFPSYSNNSKAVLKWPLPILLVIDIGQKINLDLNSARNEIIYNENWISFERKLVTKILTSIKSEVNNTYWSQLKTVLKNKGIKDSIFLEVIDAI